METKIQKFLNALSSIFVNHEVCFMKVECEEPTYCVRSSKISMFCGVELVKLIALAQKFDLHFYVRSNTLETGIDCVEFVIY